MPKYFVFIRSKIFGNKTYYYVVKSFKDGKKPKQKVVKYLGKVEDIMKKIGIAETVIESDKRLLIKYSKNN